MSFESIDEIPEPDQVGYRSQGVRSGLTVPLSVAGKVVGAVGFTTMHRERSWPPEVVHRLRVFAVAFGSVLARRESDEALQRALEEVESAARPTARRERLPSNRSPGAPRPQQHRRQEQRHPAGPGADTARISHRFDRVAARRNRHRQGALRDPDSRAERPACTSDGARELRGDSCHAPRERTVRAGERRVYRGAVAAGGTLRAGRSLDDLPRRDRRSAGGRPGQAAARARGAHRSSGSGIPSRFASTRASSRPRTGISNNESAKARFARICSIG